MSLPVQADSETHSIQIISNDMKMLVKKIQDLRHLGIEDNNIALPKICVVGDQSTGKSSLIEGMSEIKVPRSAGTCTRCPMEINLSESNPGEAWTCRVLLSRKYMFDGSRKVTKLPKKSLGPWVEQEEETEEFCILKDKSKVQEALRWAQLAILNPSQPTNYYAPDNNPNTDPSFTQVKFSPNVVRLDISAPDFPNLSFYDLPGVISQAEIDEERYLVALVENLAKEYVSKDNCIVLLTLPMTDDATNSSAARIIRDTRGAKNRTLGVLTKPDRIQQGESLSQWIEILEGDKFSLGHGYYIVRNTPDTSVEHSRAREEEEDFFSTHPWATELAPYKDRFGTRRVQAALSSLLLEQIQGSLPRVIQQIDEKAARVDAELRTLPDPPSANVPYILCGKLNHFKEQIRANVDGGSSEYPLQKMWRHLTEDFQHSLAKTRPTVELMSAPERMAYKATLKADIADDDDGDNDDDVTAIDGLTNRENPVYQQSTADMKKKPASLASGYKTIHFKIFDQPFKKFTWEEIRGINQDSYSAGIPDQTDPKAVDIMNRISVQHWDKPMIVFLTVTHKLVKNMLLGQLDAVFSEYRQTSLYRELKHILEEYLHSLRTEHFQHAEQNYSVEFNKPFTMALPALNQARKTASQYLSACRFRARAKAYLEVRSKFKLGDPRRESELKRLTNGDLGDDPYSQELDMMARSRGYYEIASSRFVDSICQGVQMKLFSKCREDLVTVIEQKLSIFDDNALDRCLELMAEDPERQHRRQDLIREREKLSKAQEWLSTAKKDDDGSETMDGIESQFGMRLSTPLFKKEYDLA
ncbi:hypothetical protein MPDQ_004747 [Monascus purpureus]|uniref:GED domain-containing protein n=1 Tax=Monascus purpureus TaxID=5098 RepID=A0A507QXA4_MONPU|nr:hypothetical protein MPDQ_004747 [Monascus purpureus]